MIFFTTWTLWWQEFFLVSEAKNSITEFRKISHTKMNHWCIHSYSDCLLQFSSVQLLSRVRLFATPWIAARQASLSITNSDSSPLSQWCHPAISSSVVPFSSCPQSLPASQSFPVSQLFAWGGQSTGVGSHALLQIFPTQGLNPGLPHCRQTLYPLSHQGSLNQPLKGHN